MTHNLRDMNYDQKSVTMSGLKIRMKYTQQFFPWPRYSQELAVGRLTTLYNDDGRPQWRLFRETNETDNFKIILFGQT